VQIFRNDKYLGGWDVERGWCGLPEEQKKAYRAQSETLRHAAWAEHEAAMAAGTSILCIPAEKVDERNRRPGESRAEYFARREKAGDQRYPFGNAREKYFGIRRMPDVITGLKIFHEELGAGVEFWEAEGQYRALTKEERDVYEGRAKATNAAAMAAYKAGRTL
jgi:hypothetical protein